MTPVNVAAMNAVPRTDAGAASWMVNLVQSVGGAVTIAVLGTLLDRFTVMQMDALGGIGAAAAAPPEPLIHRALLMGYAPVESGSVATAMLLRQVAVSANTLAFQDAFMYLALATLLGAVPALLLKPRQSGKD